MEANKLLSQYRNEVKNLCDKIITTSNKILVDKNKEEYNDLHKLAEFYKLYAEDAKKVCSVEKYELCFIGPVELGKTTLISMLLGMINRKKLMPQNNLKDCCLFKVGQRQTTLCKTKVFLNAETSKFEIKGANKEKFKNYLRSFINYLYEIKTEEAPISKEEIRAIKNMLKLGTIVNSKDIQEVLGLTSIEYTSSNEEKMIEKLYEISKYDERQESKIIFDCNKLSFFDWLKTYSKKINDCELEHYPFPLEINLYLSNKDLSIVLPDYIGSISDTRGMKDNDGERDDISCSMESIECIPIFCESIKKFDDSEGIRKFLMKYLVENKSNTNDLRYKTFLCGIEKGNELKYVNDCVSREDGIKSVIQDAKSNFGRDTLKDSNIFFQDSAPRVYADNNGNIISVDNDFEEHLKKERENFFLVIEHSLCDMYTEYLSKLKEYVKSLETKRSEQIQKNSFDMFREAYNCVKSYKEKIPDKRNELLHQIRIHINSIQPSSLRGAVNNNGSGYTANIYRSFRSCGEDIFKEECDKLYNQVYGELKQIFKADDADYKVYFDSVDGMMIKLYSQSLKECSDFYYETVETLMKEDNSLWNHLRSFWGSTENSEYGCYTVNVVEYLWFYIEKNGIKSKLVSRSFSREFFDNFLNYLNASSNVM